jgi:hypothetical protein
MSEAGNLEGGTIPLPHTCHTVCETVPYYSQSREVDGRQVGCGTSPSGLLSISPDDPTDVRSFSSYDTESPGVRQVDMIMHDGVLLSGASAAITVNDKALIGSPVDDGILVCDLPIERSC